MKLPLPNFEGVTHKYLKIKKITLHVAIAGKGKPVFLIHGWPQHWYAWRRLIPFLSKEYRLIMPDLPGFGWSEPAKNNDYRKEKLADYMTELLDALNLKQVGLVGHDWGGWVGFIACLKSPEKFSNFLALGITHPFKSYPFWQYKRFAYQLPIATPFIGERLVENYSLMKWMLKKSIYNTDAFVENDFKIFLEILKNPIQAHASSLMYRDFLTKELFPIILGKYKNQKLRVPTHLLIGQYDPVINPTLFNNSKPTNNILVEMIKDSGHFLPEEKPETIARYIEALNSK